MRLTAQDIGLARTANLYHNLDYETLFCHEQQNGEAAVSDQGAMMVETGAFTGRSPKDKYIVKQAPSSEKIAWGSINKPIEPEIYVELLAATKEYLTDKNLYVTDGYCGANPSTRQRVRFITEFAWQSHFCKNMFIRPTAEELTGFSPDFTVYNASNMVDTQWEKHGLNSEVFVIFNLEERTAIIGGTWYGGEMKKGLFTVMNYLLPEQEILPMHCSANIGGNDDVCLFFGLSGTGKTTLSTEKSRRLIGDDEHGWDDEGVFNFEGGCYAKVINLNPENEPEIYGAIRRDALLENVVADDSGAVDFADASKTENTRCSYPISHIPNHEPSLKGGHPQNIIFLCCDAFGVLPPVSQLSREQAMYYFLSGYTAKVAGTERGVTEPRATFSACFGEAFLPLPPTAYAQLLGHKIDQHKTKAFLVNTGWSGGAYGVGERMKISETRACVDAILNGALVKAPCDTLPVFDLAIPTELPGVTAGILNPRLKWSDSSAYDETAQKLATMFKDNFNKYLATDQGKEIAKAGPV